VGPAGKTIGEKEKKVNKNKKKRPTKKNKNEVAPNVDEKPTVPVFLGDLGGGKKGWFRKAVSMGARDIQGATRTGKKKSKEKRAEEPRRKSENGRPRRGRSPTVELENGKKKRSMAGNTGQNTGGKQGRPHNLPVCWAYSKSNKHASPTQALGKIKAGKTQPKGQKHGGPALFVWQGPPGR